MTDWSARWSDRVESPAAIPAGQTRFGHVTGAESRTAGAGKSAPATESVRRVSRGRLERLVDGLGDRDRAVLNSVAKFAFLSTGQIELLHFHNHSSHQAAARICRRVLRRLAADLL